MERKHGSRDNTKVKMGKVEKEQPTSRCTIYSSKKRWNFMRFPSQGNHARNAIRKRTINSTEINEYRELFIESKEPRKVTIRKRARWMES